MSFKKGNNIALGNHHSEETKEKLRQKALLRFHTDEEKRKISESLKGHTVSDETREKIRQKAIGRKHSKASNEKNSIANLGRIPWNKGKHLSKEHINNMKKSHKGKIWYKERNMPHPKLGKSNTLYQRKVVSEYMIKNNPMFNPEIAKKMSITKTGKPSKSSKKFKVGQFALEKNYFWQGGISFEPYTPEFNEQLKEQIRKRDNWTCQECHFTQEQLGYKLPVHHIDFNKKNSNPNNLISLCKSCHGKTQYNREKWIKYYLDMVKLCQVKDV